MPATEPATALATEAASEPGAEPVTEPATEPATEPLAQSFGWDDPADYKDKLLVTEIDPLGEARARGIRAGNLILTVQGNRIQTLSALAEALSDEKLAKGLRIRIASSRLGERTLFIPPMEPSTP